jgi:micrococcal nuclease
MLRRSIALSAAWVLLVIGVSGQTSGLVTRIVDGDTVVVEGVGTVRLIGVDAAEMTDQRPTVLGQARASTAYLSVLVAQKTVTLSFDQTRTDRYGRTLAYLHTADGRFINAEMIRQGYAHAFVRYPFKYLEDFRQFQTEAREAGRGLWGPVPNPPDSPANPSPTQERQP